MRLKKKPEKIADEKKPRLKKKTEKKKKAEGAPRALRGAGARLALQGTPRAGAKK